MYLNYRLLNWNVNLPFSSPTEAPSSSTVCSASARQTNFKGVMSHSEHRDMAAEYKAHFKIITRRLNSFSSDDARGCTGFMSMQGEISKQVPPDYSVFSVVVWLKKADVTTFEYLMQLKICCVLLAATLSVISCECEYFTSLCLVKTTTRFINS